jgi:hypothetical protein
MGSSLKATKLFNRSTSAREISTSLTIGRLGTRVNRPMVGAGKADCERFRTNSPRNDATEVCGSHPIRVRLATIDARRPVDAMPVCRRRFGR